MLAKVRLDFVDVARGLAMICIILGHLDNPWINRVVYTFHVPIFFLITGYFMSAKLPFRQFAKKRAHSLLIPLLIDAIFMVLFAVIFASILGDDPIAALKRWGYAELYGAGGPHSRPFSIKGAGMVWFLWATWWGVIAFRLLLNCKKEWLRALVIIVIVTFCIWSAYNWIWLPFSLQCGGVALGFMYIGWLAKRAIPHLIKLKKSVRVILTIVAFLLWFSFIRDYTLFHMVKCYFGPNLWMGLANAFRCLCACYCFLLICYYIDKFFKKFSSKVSYLGQYSLFTMCFHNIECYTWHWTRITGMLVNLWHLGTFGSTVLYWAIVAFRVALNIAVTVGLSRWNLARRAFGFAPIEKNTEPLPASSEEK